MQAQPLDVDMKEEYEPLTTVQQVVFQQFQEGFGNQQNAKDEHP